MAPEATNVHFDGIHCNLAIEKRSNGVVFMKISGTDVGEFGDAPTKALDTFTKDSSVLRLFIDTRDVRGASIEVSAEWARWLNRNKSALESVTMLTGSRFIQITAEFVRRICMDPTLFEQTLADATEID